MNWDLIIERIEDSQANSLTQVTNTATWKGLVPELIALGIDPPDATRSNLFQIIRELKIALREPDIERVQELLDWSETRSNFQLRLALGVITPIYLAANVMDEEVVLNMSVPQFQELQKRSSGYFDYQIAG
jgi:hypothetical protein